MLGKVQCEAVEQAVEIIHYVQAFFDENIAAALERWVVKNGRIIPGFGHLFQNPFDPHAPHLFALVAEAVEDGVCSRHFSNNAKAVETELTKAIR